MSHLVLPLTAKEPIGTSAALCKHQTNTQCQ